MFKTLSPLQKLMKDTTFYLIVLKVSALNSNEYEKHLKRIKYILKGKLSFCEDLGKFIVKRRSKRLFPDEWCDEQLEILKKIKYFEK
ncbi:MAG: hypothetical protein B6U95_00110 [Thermofilum sp. ex4484_82]|nr:MAG: hypothetical protein B6U95_00110 [Thermofilum sp. ex4484_82]